MRFGACLLLLCGCLRAQDPTLRGITVDSSTGRPLAGVHVHVFTLGVTGLPTSYGTVSDREGRFSIANIPPGGYFYLGEKTGYVALRKGGGVVTLPAMTIKAGEPLSGFRVEMTPRATVGGRVLDEFGDPVQNVQVAITAVSPDAPMAVSPTNSMVITDDRGEYRIPVAPGKYHVKATIFNTGRNQEVRTDGSSAIAYVPTFYPSSATLDRAAPVEVAAGALINGVDIRLTGPRNSTGVEGTVTGAADNQPITVQLLIAETSGRYSPYQNASAPDGRFAFRSLRPGNYVLFALGHPPGRTLISQRVEFSDTSPPSPVELRLNPGFDLAATVEMDGGKLPVAKRALRLQHSSVDAFMTLPPISGEIDDDGTARIPSAFRGRYRVAVQPLPEDAYVRSVELDGSPAGDELDLTRGGSRLKVVVGKNGARISGSVVDKNGARLTNTIGAVLLIRDKSRIDFNDMEHLSRITPEGSYQLGPLRPGKYWLLAVDVYRSGDFTNESALKKYADLAEEIDLKEGDRIRKDLRIVTQEALDAKKQ